MVFLPFFQTQTPRRSCYSRQAPQSVATGLTMSLSDTSHSSRSPSLSSSVDSAKSYSLPSPKGSDLVIQPLQLKSNSPYHNSRLKQPSIRRMSASDTLSQLRRFSTNTPSPPPIDFPDTRDTHDDSCSPHSPARYHPYIPRGRASVPPALHYAARSFGVMSPVDITFEEVEEVRCIITLINQLTYMRIEEGCVH